MIDSLISFLEGSKEASAFEITGFLIGLISLLIAMYALLHSWRTAGYERLQKDVNELNRQLEVHEKTIRNLEEERDGLERERNGLWKRDIEQFILSAEKEREEGNERLAVRYFKKAVASSSEYRAQAALELAYHHLGLFELDDKHMANACRYALLAYTILPGFQPAKSLVAELKSFKADGDIFRGDFDLAAQHFDDVYDFGVGMHGIDAAPLVLQLLKSYQREDDEGHFQTAFALARQAHNLAQSELPAVRFDSSASNNIPIQFQTQHAYARSLRQMGQYSNAMDIFQDVHTRKADLLGADHSSTLSSANSIAVCLSSMGRIEDALKRHRDIYVRAADKLGIDHSQTLASSHGIAECLSHLGRFEDGLNHYEDLYERQVKVLGSDHPRTLSSGHGIAQCLFNLGRYLDAGKRHEDIYKRRAKALGLDHPDTLSSSFSIALFMSTLGQYEDALKHFEDLHECECKVFGANHPHTLASSHGIAKCLSHLGRFEDGLNHYEDLYERQVKVLGSDHPHTLSSGYGIAVCLSRLGRCEDALKHHEDIHVRRVKTLGPDHPDTEASQRAIDEMISPDGDSSELN